MKPPPSKPSPSRAVQPDSATPFRFYPQDPWPGERLGLPDILQELAAQANNIFGLEESNVMVSMLAFLASALGRRQVVDDGRIQFPPAFNLLIVSEPNAQTTWINYLAKSWSAQKVEFEQPNHEALEKMIQSKLGRYGAGHSGKPGYYQSDSDDRLPNLTEMRQALQAKYAICRELDPVVLSGALVRSQDHCVTILNGALDPMTQWMLLPKARQEQLNGMLCSSWKGIPVNVAKEGKQIQASINLLGITGMDALRMFITKAAIKGVPPPILFIRQRGQGRRFPAIGEPEFGRWSELLEAAHRKRFEPHSPGICALERADTVVAEDFFSEFRSALNAVPAAMVPFLEWVPELALRIYILTAMGKGRAGEKAPAGTAPSLAMRSALLLTRWLAQEQYAMLQGILETGDPAREMPSSALSDRPDNTDISALRDSFLARLGENGPMTRRDLQRTFHHLDAGMRDLVIRSLKLAGEVVETPEGRIALPA